ncbi:zinc ribbon domain-containing protein [Haladaptatus sp. DFWS20]|uniref:zinc ribbon domain-containing protein n=1 Tax=Haladaptatus sp. DFWS20 TaxID=3403467 RepID=UPI003EBEA303
MALSYDHGNIGRVLFSGKYDRHSHVFDSEWTPSLGFARSTCSTSESPIFKQRGNPGAFRPGAKAFHAWAFRRLYEYVEYKATEFGISTKQVDPAYTSQRCSKCGHTERGNRPKRKRFCCRKCGYEVHADYNAAKNIGIKHVHAGQKSPRGRANRQLALKSGTLSVSDEFTSAEVSA